MRMGRINQPASKNFILCPEVAFHVFPYVPMEPVILHPKTQKGSRFY